MFKVKIRKNDVYLTGIEFNLSYEGMKFEHIPIEEDLQIIKLFLTGIKPAILLEDVIVLNEKVKKKYPHILLNDGDTSHMLLFQTIEQKNKFQEKGLVYLHKEELPYYKSDVIGEYLGYPPKAIQNFIELEEDEGKYATWTFIHYHGIIFGCDKKDIDECIEWLLHTYSIPASLQTQSYYILNKNNYIEIR